MNRACQYCGLRFVGAGYSPDGESRYCCYGCYLVERILGARGEEGIASSIILRLGAGAFLSMNVMCISLVMYLDTAGDLGSSVTLLRWTLLALSTPALAILGWPFILGAIRQLRNRRLSTDALIATGSVAAYAVSAVHVVRGAGHVYFDTATMLLVIVTVGRLLEASAKSRTSGAIRNVLDLLPGTARVLREGAEVEVRASDVRRGDVLVVKPGERVAADGRVVSGECMIEEAAFTGESRPRPCGPGDRVFGGSVDCDGLIHVEATSVGADSLLAQMQRMVERARTERAPVERLADRISSFFVPSVWLAAIGSAGYWALYAGNAERAGMSALAVLVVACPCALGLATPMATCLALGRAARSGALIGSGGVLESLSRVTTVFWDKTGTLTDGRLNVSEVIVAPAARDSVDQETLLTWAASVEAGAEHSIGAAIVAAARDRGLRLGKLTHFRAIPGQGVEGTVELDGDVRRVTVGSSRMVPSADTLLQGSDPLTAAFVALDGELRGAILLADSVRAGASEVIARLSAAGVRSVIISGDRDGPVNRIASKLGIDAAIASCAPEDKIESVRKARAAGERVAMVGDGINDAPALAEADVGIAVGGGTDLAREASDITLLGDDLSRIPLMLDLSRTTYRVIRQNLAWAFGYNSAAIALAFFGFVHPLIAAVAMLCSSLTVVGNSMRVNKGTHQQSAARSQQTADC